MHGIATPPSRPDLMGPHPTRVVIVGAGPAGTRCAEHLAADPGVSVTLIGDEPSWPYNRVALSQWLAGDIAEGDLTTHPPDRLRRDRISYRRGVRVTAIDRANHIVQTSSGEVFPYNHCVLALGSAPVRLRLPGASLPGVVMYRTRDDVAEMIGAAATGGSAIVIGGGLLGIEAAAGLARRGMAVTVIHAVGRLMERQLDDGAASLLVQRLSALGVSVELSARTESIVGRERAMGVGLSDGRVLAARLVVMAVGVQPVVDLARECGLTVQRGIVVDASMRSSDPSIFAIGECAEFDGQCCGLVAPAFVQAEAAAAALIRGAASYAPPPPATVLKIAGANVWSAGPIDVDGADSIVASDPDDETYCRLLVRDDRLVAATLFGEITHAPWYLRLITDRVSINPVRAALPFGPAFAGDAA